MEGKCGYKEQTVPFLSRLIADYVTVVLITYRFYNILAHSLLDRAATFDLHILAHLFGDDLANVVVNILAHSLLDRAATFYLHISAHVYGDDLTHVVVNILAHSLLHHAATFDLYILAHVYI